MENDVLLRVIREEISGIKKDIQYMRKEDEESLKRRMKDQKDIFNLMIKNQQDILDRHHLMLFGLDGGDGIVGTVGLLKFQYNLLFTLFGLIFGGLIFGGLITYFSKFY